MGLKSWIIEKFNPAQAEIARNEGDSIYADNTITFEQAYDRLTSVRRAVDMIVNGASSFDVDVKDKINGIITPTTGTRKSKVEILLNFQPNPYIDTNKFRRLIYIDLVLTGNAFIYYDGVYLYNLPSSQVEILTDPIVYVKGYKYNGTIDFKANEVIHIADNSSTSIYRGTSRLKSTSDTLLVRSDMTAFQGNFFKNGAVPGLVIKSPNVLGDKIKARMIESWQSQYSPTKGGKRPLILDGGLDLDRITEVNFRELDFKDSITSKDLEILVALGVPEVLISSGNNANITPNLRLFYMETILPLVKMVNASFERFFGYDLELEVSKVSALQPDLKDEAMYNSTLVNGGVISPNEARETLRYDPKPGHDDLRVPANIAGSAAGEPGGGAPKKDENN